MSELAAKLARRRALNGEGDTLTHSLTSASNSASNSASASVSVSVSSTIRDNSNNINTDENKERIRREKEEEEAARVKAEEAVVVARVKAEEEEQEEAARVKAEEAVVVARVKAEQEAAVAREMAEMEEAARVKKREEEEAKAEMEEEARVKAEQEEAARVKKREEEEEAARVKAEQEEAVAKEMAEMEEASRVKAEQEEEAARVKAEQEAAARVKAEEEEAARVKAEQEAIAKEMAELEEAARVKARDEEEARVKAEQEAVAKEMAEMEEAARQKAEQEETARVKAEEDAMEEAARVQAEEVAARLKAEHEAAEEESRMKAEEEAMEHKANSLQEGQSINKHEKVDDELKELESFFDNMNDDMEGLGLPEPPLSREISSINGGTDLFAEDSATFCVEGDDSSMRRQELLSENDKLKAEETSLTNEVSAKSAQIRKIRKQIDSFSRQLGEGEFGGGGGEVSISLDDEFGQQSHRHLSYKKSRDLFADDIDLDLQDSQDSLKEDELAGRNAELIKQITALKVDVQRSKEVIVSSQRELDALRKQLLQSSSTGHDPSRGSMSAQVVLQSNLDSMGFQAGNISTLMEVLDEHDSESDHENIFGLSDNDLKGGDGSNELENLLRAGSGAAAARAGTSLDSNFWASQSMFHNRMVGQDSEGSEQAGLLARQKMDTHGLFGNTGNDDVDATDNSSSSKNKAMFKDDSGVTERVRKKETDKKIYHYHEFMSKVMHPDHVNIATAIKNFLMSVLGPTNDCRHPPPGTKLDYEFHGVSRLAARCDDFMSAIVEHLRVTPGWSGDTDERYISARDCLEKCIMGNLHKYAFESVMSPADDEELLTRMKLLSFVPASALDIKPELVNDLVFALARDELSKINAYTLPADKIACVTRCAAVIFRSLNLARAKTEENLSDSALGADDFLPMFILVVMRSQVPQLYSNCEYIQSFHSPDQMRSKAGYCFVNLRSAMEFILSATSEDLTMDAAEFDSKLKEATANLTANNGNDGI